MAVISECLESTKFFRISAISFLLPTLRTGTRTCTRYFADMRQQSAANGLSYCEFHGVFQEERDCEMMKTEKQLRPRRIPLLSRLMFFPVQLIFGAIHVILSKLGPRIEPTASMFVVSGFFVALPLVPLVFFWTTGIWLEAMGLYSASDFWKWIVAPFYAIYVTNILFFDQTHKIVYNSGAYEPRNTIERAASLFLWAFTRYIDNYITCVPWSKDATLPTGDTTYVFGVHPHGIHCTGLAELANPYNDFAKLFPNVSGRKLTGLVASVIFKIPVVREMFLYMGYVDASRSIASKALAAGQSIFVCVGGEEESLLTTPGKDIYVLIKRKGFIRLALSHGASLVPVLGIGTNEAYTTYSALFKSRVWLQKNFGIALPIFHGRWFSPLPHPVPIKVVVGEPIPTPKPDIPGEKPTEELIDEFHAKYIEAVRKLHAQHAPKGTELIIQ